MAKSDFSIFEKQIAENVAAWNAKVRATGRPFKEWIGKTADAMPPERVRERIRETWDDTCYLSGIQFRGKPFDVEHSVRVKDGGLAANREGVMRPALRDAHVIKTAREKREQASADRKKRKGAGTKAKPKKPIQGPDFEEAEPQASATKIVANSKVAQIRALREAQAR